MTDTDAIEQAELNIAWRELYEFASNCIRISEGIIDFDTFVESGKERFFIEIKRDNYESENAV
jgi:hypothetical protein